MPFVALTGNFGMGKSTVLRLFKTLGAYTIDADELVRDIFKKPETINRIAALMGKEVITKKYVVDKKRLASMIFNDPEKRKTLERIIHPEVLKTARDIKSTILLKDPHAIILFEIPLLFEAGYEKIFDRIIVVHCNKKTAITRLIRKGFPKEEAIKRMQAQIPISRKKASADFLINNNSTIEKTKTQVRRIFNLLQ